ncbi:MAG: 2-dehydropantoate 2-reductase [Rubrivivax sp.]
MRILIIGAGAIGGYFGGRLLQAGRDVTFLVRERRAAELAGAGLVVRSPCGDLTLRDPPHVLAKDIDQTFDLILLSCKAYDLPDAMASFAPAVGEQSMILPLLNGMRHLETLAQRFGRSRVLGGQCVTSATLGEDRAVLHLNNMHRLSFGELDGADSQRMRNLADVLGGAGFEALPSRLIVQDMWEKWVFLATLAAVSCVMRATLGDVLKAPGGEAFILSMFDECRGIAEGAGHAPRAAFLDQARSTLSTPASPLAASMLRDVQADAAIEADQILGDLLHRREAQGSAAPRLSAAYTHLKAYEARRERMRQAASQPTSSAR